MAITLRDVWRPPQPKTFAGIELYRSVRSFASAANAPLANVRIEGRSSPEQKIEAIAQVENMKDFSVLRADSQLRSGLDFT
jgi:ribosomal protein L10